LVMIAGMLACLAVLMLELCVCRKRENKKFG
jgi:hypothetical protein